MRPVARAGTHEPAPTPGPARAAPKPPPHVVSAPVDAATSASPKPDDTATAPKVTVASTVDGAALRARHRERLRADKTPVTVLTGDTAGDLGQRLCAAVVPKRPPETPVLIKPNMAGFNWFHDPRTHNGDDGVKGRITDPEFVRGIVRCLKARGHAHITIADGFTGKPPDWQRLAKVSGYGAMAKEEGVALVALDDDGIFDVEAETPGKPLGVSGMERSHVPTLLVPKIVAEHLDHGLYISAPKIKTHRFAVFSVAIKGMQGTTMYSDAKPAYQQKWRSLRELDRALKLLAKNDPSATAAYVRSLETFAERMVDILEVEAPDVVLAEGAPAMSGDGFEKLYPSPENVAIGGTNAILVDRVAAQYLGLWANDALARALPNHKTSPLLEVAARRFGVDVTQPELTGDGAALLAAPRPAHLIAMSGFELDETRQPEAADVAALPKELHAPKIDGEPTIDGKLDDIWSAATPITFTTDWAGHTTATATTVRALWSPHALCMLWELADTTPFTDIARPIDVERVDLYTENCVELLLVLDAANRQRYAEIELGPFGHFYDLMVDRAKKPRADAAWSAQLRIGTQRTGNRATIEVAIGAPEVTAALAPGATLPIGLYRTEGKSARLYLAAFPTRTPKPNFHVPDAFGTLILE